ncbi:hypothetical protein Droror1_Dr00017068 [Drosera rotundifolia]
MSLAAAVKSTTRIFWKPTGTLQQTQTNTITKSGIGLHSGNPVTVTLCPELPGKGRFFDVDGRVVGASIDSVVPSALCTTLCGEEGVRLRTIEDLVSALEATEVDNCRVEIRDSGGDRDVEVPILDGSSKEWVEAIEQTGLEDALDIHGNVCERMAPFINEPVSMWRDDSIVAAFPSPVTRITYGINFPQVGNGGIACVRLGYRFSSVMWYSSRSYSRRLNRRIRLRNQPVLDGARFNKAVSELPPGFTAEDLHDAIVLQDDPLICLELFNWAS